MENILLIATIGLLNVACFFIGACTVQKAGKGEEITAPTPANLYESHKEKEQERREKEEARKEAEKIEKILLNMERYDGTSAGQQDV